MELFEIRHLKEQLSQSIDDLGLYLKIDEKRDILKKIELEFENPDIWSNQERVKIISKEKTKLSALIKMYDDGLTKKDDVDVLLDMYQESKDEEVFKELESTVIEWKKAVADVEFKRMLSGEADFNSAIVSINAGSGGTESQDWASMLYRMLSMYADKHKFKVSELDYLDGEEAGIKSVTFLVEGVYAYGLFKSEAGVHRLVRISPFDSSARRHTSFTSISVTPEIDDDILVEIKDDDIRIDTYRSSGAGGQHVNKTDSAIRITHFATGIVVTCQNERSQHKNKESAFKVLRSKLYELEVLKRKEKEAQFSGDKKEISWGSQIRSYVLHPYKMVKDHRTDVETGNSVAVLNGDLDIFVKAYLLKFGEPV